MKNERFEFQMLNDKIIRIIYSFIPRKWSYDDDGIFFLFRFAELENSGTRTTMKQTKKHFFPRKKRKKRAKLHERDWPGIVCFLFLLLLIRVPVFFLYIHFIFKII